MTRAGLLPAILLAASCARGAPMQPTPASPVDRFELETGPQWLDLLGFGLSDDPDYPACVPPFVPRDGTQVVTRVLLAREGLEWVVRSSEPETGNIVMRFHETGRSLFGMRVTGTIRGWALNVPRFSFELARDARIAVVGSSGRGSADVEGTIQRLVSFVLGRVSGDIRFSDRSATEWSRCSIIQWSLQPVGGIGN